MATHYTCGVTHFFSLRFCLRPELLSELLPASVRQAFSELHLSSEKAEWSFSFLPEPAFGLLSHSLPNHWQNAAAVLRPAPRTELNAP